MANKATDRIDDYLRSMDTADLIRVIHILQEDAGDEKLLRIVKTVASANVDFDPETISKKAEDCTEMDERKYYSICNIGEDGEYVERGERASKFVLENLQKCFGKELNQLVMAGHREKASEYIRAIADGLEDSNGILAYEDPDFISEYVDRLRERADRQEFKNALKW